MKKESVFTIRKMLRGSWRGMKTWQISTAVLYALVGLTTVVFALFWLVGYDMPFLLEPEYNAPLLTGALLVFVYLMVTLAAAAAVLSVWHGLRTRSRSDSTVNRVPAGKIALITLLLLAASLIATFLLGSTKPVEVNGEPFAEAFWLKLTDMFINTITILMLVAAAAVVANLMGLNRKLRHGGEGK